ncbi:unnamed protein product [Aphanomyces euteiches]|uniref:Uncharacterized protein n=1 Tax=Aphanomyces euteiches TaxID=100861 RepID=A0A6G0W6F3_9STRA|nr:hypothetical protein Ae201684_018267 [Aphanomyces euteiches]KAH9069162.1 hypothetical protein Ae201684P_004852 [Aphanomyces euteiches]KAH9098955.1 hypothetical protein LEN26_016449 [Aphanomyces euteiches]KAH9106092.1 hypothetical protein AeMF1_018200 [Aphanomyces euteiches]KAH9143191.1 hypothetical protein AeRB84_012795 [Aphanomyces euteiches]
MSSGDGYDEVYRLKSNHKELLMHKHTLEKQLEMKQTQLKELKKAIEACQAQLEDDAPIVRKRDRSSISSSTPIAPAKRMASLDA